MSVEILSRIQFAFTIAFHYLFPPLTIGLGLVLIMMEGMWLRTRDPVYHNMARFWTRIFGLIFGLGVATGIVMEFEFGTNWATYSRFVGDIFGLGMFPHLVVSVPNPEHSLTAYNAASTQKTLKIMTLIAAIGAPIVLAYTTTIYYIFRGKVKLGKDSY